MKISRTKLQNTEEHSNLSRPLMSLSAQRSVPVPFWELIDNSKNNFVITLSICVSIFATVGSATSSSAADALVAKTTAGASTSSSSGLSTSLPYTTTAALVTAQKYYASGDANRAFQSITTVLKLEPSNATAHYLMANCLLKLGRAAEAGKEYYAAESLAPRSKIADYSRIARTHIEAMQKEQAKSRVISNSDDDDAEATEDDRTSVSSSGSDASTVRAASTASNTNSTLNTRAATSSEAVPPGTLELIRKQAILAKRMALENGAAEAESERQKGIYEAKSLQEKAERNAARPAGSNEPINVPSEERERIKAEAAVIGERLKQIGDWKASIVEEWSHEKSDEIQRQADDLQHQLIDNRPSNMKLNPVGTNLYIRNYAKPPLTPLQAEIKSLSTKTTATLTSKQTNLTLRTHGAQSKNELPNRRGQTVVKVEGKVLR
jgi:hypothetical protein